MIPSIPVTVFDFRVLAHNIFNALEKSGAESEEQQRMWIKCCWVMMLNRGPNTIPYEPHTLVVVDDNGSEEPYWRKQLFPEYKEGRRIKPDSFYSVAQIGLNYILKPGSPIYYFQKPSYEADDFAGALVYIKRQCQAFPDFNPVIANRQINLWTVDSDWLQLVGDGVTWHNTGPWEPRIRDVKGTLYWATVKKKWKGIKTPGDIILYKMKNGDSSDNLPKGTPRYMIDLMNSHAKYHLKNHPATWSQLWSVLEDKKCNVNQKHYKSAKNWIFQNGLSLPS